MDTPQSALAHAIRLKCGLPPGTPNEAQLAAIVAYIRDIAKQRTPTLADWKKACEIYVPGAGTYIYKGLDMSDLNALLAEIRR